MLRSALGFEDARRGSYSLRFAQPERISVGEFEVDLANTPIRSLHGSAELLLRSLRKVLGI